MTIPKWLLKLVYPKTHFEHITYIQNPEKLIGTQWLWADDHRYQVLQISRTEAFIVRVYSHNLASGWVPIVTLITIAKYFGHADDLMWLRIRHYIKEVVDGHTTYYIIQAISNCRVYCHRARYDPDRDNIVPDYDYTERVLRFEECKNSFRKASTRETVTALVREALREAEEVGNDEDEEPDSKSNIQDSSTFSQASNYFDYLKEEDD